MYDQENTVDVLEEAGPKVHSGQLPLWQDRMLTWYAAVYIVWRVERRCHVPADLSWPGSRDRRLGRFSLVGKRHAPGLWRSASCGAHQENLRCLRAR